MIFLIVDVLVLMTVVMLSGWIFQRAANNGGWTDVFWTFGTGALCALAALIPFGAEPGAAWRRVLVAAMVAVWALRLGTCGAPARMRAMPGFARNGAHRSSAICSGS
jgi:steroid 5-alpha reductase family enzyme